MVVVCRALREQLAASAQIEREMVALKGTADRDFVEVPFEWQMKQTAKAALFPSYGWVPHVALRWRKADGTVVSWSLGHAEDTFLMAVEFAARKIH
ncbi:MAG TPA: hypothetical protein VMQ76_01270 [Terracidiphilus sp.]|nr:hypothetical protein [Terracidiphilus sp.]